MRSSYYIRRFHEGLLSFASVDVNVEVVHGEPNTVVLGPEVRTHQSRAVGPNRVDIDAWVAGAVKGIEGILARQHVTPPPRSWRITIERMIPHFPDSSANAFECAAAMAAFKGMFPEAAEPRIEWDDGWRLKFDD